MEAGARGVPIGEEAEAHAGANQVRGCRNELSCAELTTGRRTDYIHGRCARQDLRAHTHMTATQG